MDPRNLVLVLGHMRLNPDIRIARGQLAGTAQLGIGAGGGKARCDGIAQTALAMPVVDQCLAIEQALHSRVHMAAGGMLVQQVQRGIAVHQAQAGYQAQAARLRFGKQGVDRGGVRSGKGQRGGHTIAQQLVDKKACGLSAVVDSSKALLFREGVVLQPGKQAAGRRADDIGLRIVHMQINKAGGNDAARQMLYRHLRIAR